MTPRTIVDPVENVPRTIVDPVEQAPRTIVDPVEQAPRTGQVPRLRRPGPSVPARCSLHGKMERPLRGRTIVFGGEGETPSPHPPPRGAARRERTRKELARCTGRNAHACVVPRTPSRMKMPAMASVGPVGWRPASERRPPVGIAARSRRETTSRHAPSGPKTSVPHLRAGYGISFSVDSVRFRGPLGPRCRSETGAPSRPRRPAGLHLHSNWPALLALGTPVSRRDRTLTATLNCE